MYGPSLETPPFVQSIDLQEIDLHAVELLDSKPVSLEQVELEILLSMKIEDGQSFEKAVQATMVCSGNEFYSHFPATDFRYLVLKSPVFDLTRAPILKGHVCIFIRKCLEKAYR